MHGQLAVPSLKRRVADTDRRAADGFARPIGRALIEAAKRLECRGIDCCLHGQLAVPSLKRELHTARRATARCLHGQLAVPSLKPVDQVALGQVGDLFARPIGRALIEAREPLAGRVENVDVCTANWPCPH